MKLVLDIVNVDDGNFSSPEVQLPVVQVLTQSMINCVKNFDFISPFDKNRDVDISVGKLQA